MIETISIVIVCMNKIDNLRICIHSIEKNTSIDSYKIYVVAYLFSEDNLNLLKKEFPKIEIIESNEIRGFAENNNLALKQLKSKYCFVLNDDTEFITPVIDILYDTLQNDNRITLVSPLLLNSDLSIQMCGRRKYTYLRYLCRQIGIRYSFPSKYENKNGLFKTYNITGAAFMVRRAIFEQMGFFNEQYFFCPEDIELSTKLNRMEYTCYVNTKAKLIHYEGKTAKKSKLFYATTVSAILGCVYYYSTKSRVKLFLLKIIFIIKAYIHNGLYKIRKSSQNEDYSYIYKTVVSALKRGITTKELFIEEYKKI